MERIKRGRCRLDLAYERWLATGSQPAEDLADADQPDDRAAATALISIRPPEFATPFANRLRGHAYATCKQERFHIAKAQTKRGIESYGVTNDLPQECN